ncbi:hypothetical protein FRX31_033378 [Thalictrum thalictroides]|uniref:Uncharacterized protein n=1 Tax=Thalictrum thalictroides TaxID=46969 RepID=A0A7J6UXW3_THATH|nr:hypothetical protein FRX31_033378 [Thalictrum thalictroides]
MVYRTGRQGFSASLMNKNCHPSSRPSSPAWQYNEMLLWMKVGSWFSVKFISKQGSPCCNSEKPVY